MDRECRRVLAPVLPHAPRRGKFWPRASADVSKKSAEAALIMNEDHLERMMGG